MIDDQKEVIWDGPIEERLNELKKKMAVYEENQRKLRDRYLKEQEMKQT